MKPCPSSEELLALFAATLAPNDTPALLEGLVPGKRERAHRALEGDAGLRQARLAAGLGRHPDADARVAELFVALPRALREAVYAQLPVHCRARLRPMAERPSCSPSERGRAWSRRLVREAVL